MTRLGDTPGIPALAAAGSRVVLVGTGSHAETAELASLPSVRRTVNALEDRLVRHCSLSREHLTVVHDPSGPDELYAMIEAAAVDARDTFVLFYAGHGVKDNDGTTLFLATGATMDLQRKYPESQALSYTRITSMLRRRCSAKAILVVLDCCFSGLAALPSPYNSLLFASADPDAIAYAPMSTEHTAFTGTLIKLLDQGEHDNMSGLSAARLAWLLDRECRSAGRPPVIRYTEGVADLILTGGRQASDRHTIQAVGRRPPMHPDGLDAADACPYPGLKTFGPEDSWCFFGRDREIGRLLREASNLLYNPGPLLVVGESGIGKSSLLRAGLLDAIDHGGLDITQSDRWPRFAMTPGTDPMTSLSRGLARLSDANSLGVGVPQELTSAQQAVTAAKEVVDAFARVHVLDGPRLIIVVDQFEELFTQTAPSVRELFCTALAGLCTSDHATATPLALVVASLRSEYVGRLPELTGELPGLAAPVIIGAMDTEQLRLAIREPAALAGVAVDDELTNHLLYALEQSRVAGERDDKTSAAVLPQLSHSLRRTWHFAALRQPHGINTLSLADYEGTGGIGEAVARTAESVLEAATQTGRAAIRRLFLRLLAISEDGPVSRRRVELYDLLDVIESDLLATLVDARLVTSHGGGIEITQESLVYAWPRLRDWIADERAALPVQHRLFEAASGWNASHERGDLLRGKALSGIEEWIKDPDHHARLDENHLAFLSASVRQRGIGRRTRRAAVGVVATLLVALGATGLIARHQAALKAHQTLLAQGRGLLADAETMRDSDPRTSLLLDVQAIKLNDATITEQAQAGLRTTFSSTHYAGTISGQDGSVHGLAISPDGSILAAADEDGTVALWDLSQTPARLAATRQPAHGAALYAAAFSPIGHLLATAGGDQTITLWDTSDARDPVRLGALTSHTATINALGFSGDGRLLASAGDDGTVMLWRVTAPSTVTPLSTLTPQLGPLTSVALSAKGGRLAATAVNGTTVVWSIADPASPALSATLAGTGTRSNAIAFSPDGRDLVTTLDNGTALLRTLADPTHPSSLASHVGPALAVAFSPDATALAVAGKDGVTTLWNVSDPGHPTQAAQLKSPDGAVDSVAFLPDGGSLVTGQQDGVINLWNTSVKHQPTPLIGLSIGDRPATAVGFTPDGRLLAVVRRDRVVLWNVTTPNRPVQLPTPLTAPGLITALAFSPDGALAVVGEVSGTAPTATMVALWSVAGPDSPRLLRTLDRQDGDVSAVVISRGGRVLAVATQTGTIDLWDVTDPNAPRPLPSVEDRTDPLTSLAISPDGRYLAATSAQVDRYADHSDTTLWDIADPRRPKKIVTLTNHSRSSLSVAFSPDGTTLASSGSEGATYLWPLVGMPNTDVEGVTDIANSLTYSADGRSLAGATASGDVSVWNVRSPTRPTLITTLPDGTSNDDAAAFSPTHDHLLATADAAGVTTLWDLTNVVAAVTDPVAVACSLAGPALSRATWQRFLSDLPYQETCTGG